MMVADKNIPVVMDKKEAVSDVKKHLGQKWNRKYQLSVKVEKNTRGLFGGWEQKLFWEEILHFKRGILN